MNFFSRSKQTYAEALPRTIARSMGAFGLGSGLFVGGMLGLWAYMDIEVGDNSREQLKVDVFAASLPAGFGAIGGFLGASTGYLGSKLLLTVAPSLKEKTATHLLTAEEAARARSHVKPLMLCSFILVFMAAHNQYLDELSRSAPPPPRMR